MKLLKALGFGLVYTVGVFAFFGLILAFFYLLLLYIGWLMTVMPPVWGFIVFIATFVFVIFTVLAYDEVV